MAKKTHRIIIHLKCQDCKEQNYTTVVSKLNTPDKLELKKFCKRCRKQTPHKQFNKLK